MDFRKIQAGHESSVRELASIISTWVFGTVRSTLKNTQDAEEVVQDTVLKAIEVIMEDNSILYNCQKVEYSDDFVYVSTKGIPAYPTGPFQDGNPSQATSQNAIFKIPRKPVEKTGTKTATTAGNIGVFINGVALFDYRDGVAWNNTTLNICRGPGNPPCPGGMGAAQAWNRDAIPAERVGFDCAKGHPAMGNYHHHQNPSAFKLDINVVSTVCNLYAADGLYSIDSTKHSPLIGFAYDGFPIYGAYGYKNIDGTGGIVRIKSSYVLKNQTTRVNGPNIGLVVGTQTFFNGYFKEDYEYIPTSASTPDYLDIHNGRFCVTPEYPNGTYAYFATVDEKWNSTYPYVVGPTFYGVRENRKVTTINEATTVYNSTSSGSNPILNSNITVFPNPSSDLIAVQINDILHADADIQLYSSEGKMITSKTINAGSTIAYFDTQYLYAGTYFIKIVANNKVVSKKVVLSKLLKVG